MNWSKEEQAVLEQLQELPEFRLDQEREFRIFEQVRNRVKPAPSRKKRRTMYAAAVCAAAAIVLSVGVYGSDLLLQSPRSAQLPESVSNVVLQLQAPQGEVIQKEGLEATLHALERRIVGMGIQHAKLEAVGQDQIRLQLPASSDWTLVKKSLLQSHKLELKSPDGTVVLNANDVKGVTVNPDDSQKVIIDFKDALKVKAVTQAYVGQQLSMWLDDTLLHEAVVSEVIETGRLQIDSGAAAQLASLLNAGTLPYVLQEVEE